MYYSKLNSRGNHGLIIIILLASVIASTFFINKVQAAGQPWWNTDWKYRAPMTITSTPSLSGYTVLITVDTHSLIVAGKMKSDGSDIRFADVSGTELSYWIEKPGIDTSTTRIWVKVPSISAGSTAIWMYYGNPSATATSNGASTFELFDDDWTFSTSGGNPVHSATQSWWESTVSYPVVFEDTSFPTRPRFHMLYDGHNVIGHAKGYAWSADLKTWTEYNANPYPPNPILGAAPYTGGSTCAWGDAIKVGSTYYLYYSRGPGTIYRAESTDLINWVNLVPITGGSFGTAAAVLKQGDGITPITVGGKYWMVYFPGGSPGSMYLASSTDLLNWTPYGSPTPILNPTTGGWDASGLWTPSFVRFDAPYNSYYIYYQGQGAAGWQTGYAKASAYSGGNPIAPDSTTWSKSSDAVIKLGSSGSWDSGFVIDPMIRKFDSTYYVFYTGNVANGYATSTSPEGPWTKLAPSAGGLWTRNGGTVSGGILTLGSGSSIKSTSTYQYRAMGYRAKFGASNQEYCLKWGGYIDGSAGVRTMIGSNKYPRITNAGLYLRNYGTAESNVVLSGVTREDFHIFEVLWKSGQSKGIVDHGALTVTLTTQVPTTTLPVTFYNFEDTVNSLMVDWVFVRSYSDPEPTTGVGSEETRACTIESCDSSGVQKDDFLPSDIVNATGTGYSPSKTYDIYVVNNRTWSNGDSITDHDVASKLDVSPDSTGKILTSVWNPTLTPGDYDIIADVDGDGTYDAGLDAIDNIGVYHTGFFVIPEYAIGTILALGVCFASVAVYKRSKRVKQKDL